MTKEKNEINQLVDFLKDVNKENPPVIMDEIDDTVSFYADTGIYALNYQLTRKIKAGFPLGRIITIVGDSTAGKTAMALQFATIKDYNAILYLQSNGEDAEKSMINKFTGIDQKKFIRKTINTFEELKTTLEKTLVWNEQNDCKICIIVDSITGLTNEDDEVTGYAGGRKAALFKNILRTYANKLKNINSTLILISQFYLNLQAKQNQDPRIIGGGLAVKQYSHLILELTPSKSDSDIVKGNVLGALSQAIKVKIIKSRYGTQYSELDYIFEPARGFSKLTGLFSLCEDLTIIVKQGRMYYIPTFFTKKKVDEFTVFADVDLDRDLGFYAKDFEDKLNENPELIEILINIIDKNFGDEKIFDINVLNKINERKKKYGKGE